MFNLNPVIRGHEDNGVVTQESILDKTEITEKKRKFYKNIIKYLDEHLYFLFLKNTDPLYGLNFETQLPYYIRVDVGISLPIIIYQKAFPEDEDNINNFILDLIKENIQQGIFTVSQNIIDLKNSGLY